MIKHRHFALVLAASLIGGCATSSKVNLPDGSKGFTVNCDGAALSWNLCYQKAGELCPAGYETITSNSNTSAAGVLMAPQVERAMVIRCK